MSRTAGSNGTFEIVQMLQTLTVLTKFYWIFLNKYFFICYILRTTSRGLKYWILRIIFTSYACFAGDCRALQDIIPEVEI